MSEEKQKIFLQFIKFSIVGISNVVVNLLVYYLLLVCNIHYIVSNSIGYVAGILNSYCWNNHYVFQTEGQGLFWKKFGKVLVCYGITYFITTLLLYILVDINGLSDKLAPIRVLFVTTPINFCLNKYWAFKEKTDEDYIDSNTNL